MPKVTDCSLKQAASLILKGQVGIFPTETVYGLGANAFNEKAVLKIFSLKNRPRFNPLIVHIANRGQLLWLTEEIPSIAERLIEQFWPGPLTLIFRKKRIVSPLITAGLGTVAIRMPRHPKALQLIRTANVPIAAPSANYFQRISPTRYQDIDPTLAKNVGFVLKGGACQVGLESTILQLTPEPKLLRAGGTPVEALEEALKRKIKTSRSKVILSPGRTKKHYSPHTPLKLCVHPPKKLDKNTGYIFWTPSKNQTLLKNVAFFSPTGSLEEGALRLFRLLHLFDKKNYKTLWVQKAPPQGLGRAINDRLSRAAASRD